MEEVEKNTHLFRNGVLIGLAAGAIFLIANKTTRNKMTQCIEDCAAGTKRVIGTVKENREPFIDQLKGSVEKITTIVGEASEDIEKLVDSSRQIKGHTNEVLKTIQETKEEFQSITQQLKGKESSLEEDILPQTKEWNRQS